MAAPHVSGIAGLILSKNPSLDHIGLKSAILDTVDKVPSVAGKMVSGGRLNALAAVCSLNTLPGDLSFDNNLSLEDAILALQIVAGLNSAICPVRFAPALDVNEDGRIGMEEAIYAIQRIAGM